MDYDTDNKIFAIYKVVLIGDSGVGKTNIISRFTDNTFELNTKSTIGVEFRTRTMEVGNKLIKLQIWDTAGQERYRAITHAYYRGAHGVILVYDVTSIESFNHLSKWLEEIKYHATNAKLIIIGNKIDMKHLRMVRMEDAVEFAKKHGCVYMETSALNGDNILEAYEYIGKMVIEETIKLANGKMSLYVIQLILIQQQ